MRIFWPANCLDGLSNEEDVLIIGWNNLEGDAVVVTALPHLKTHLVAQLLEVDALVQSDDSYRSESILQYAINVALAKNGISSANVNGHSHASRARTASQLYARFNFRKLEILGSTKHNANFLISIDRHSRRGLIGPPVIRDQQGNACLIITFDPPDPRRIHYFTLEKAKIYDYNRLGDDDSGALSQALRAELDFHAAHSERKTDKWEVIVAQLNCVFDLQVTLRRNATLKFPELAQEPELIKNYMSSDESDGDSTLSFTQKYKSRPRSRSFITPRLKMVQFIMTLRSIIELGLRILETACFRKVNLISLFCTAQQIDLRLNQLCYLPHEYIAITKRGQQDWHWLTPDRNEAYIRFNNYLWLGINDLIFGAYLCRVLTSYADELSLGASVFMKTLCTRFIELTSWLMSWPAGFKLNTQLAYFLGDVTIWIIHAWYYFLSSLLTPRTMKFGVSFIAISGLFGGATLQISLIIDLFALMSFHLFLLYQLLARMYSQQCRVLLSLFRVFRGRKYNDLRRRVDHGDYDVHQLLLGTILFTVVLFLLPTIFAFYVVFAIARLAVLTVIGVLCMTLAFLNYFPLFPLLLRVKSPRRVPSGITFSINARNPEFVHMETKPMQLSEIFSQYLTTTSLFARDMFNPSVVKELCTGELVNLNQSKLYASLYNMLPSRRGTAHMLYTELREYFSV